ncbi:BRCT domain-containing protein [Annulohypoxylon maeteangense]|uniref:BRCT domain-containing protein n=1 Tax=Annulohypoxylon maeteangense TaxID=1927788 RepID=UPI0020073E3C|nr:BRCT domain-containing protein [Annulohypoxylon maeteangense]KAI0887939.1 BRCT domain-containing protein [Annulohypoxylon maeteangense]
MPDQKDSELFSLCKFAFIKCPELSQTVIGKLAATITQYGGEVQIAPRGKSRLPLDGLTHIIATSVDFEEYTEATARMIPVVRPKWISASLTKGRQAQIRPFTPDPRMIFSDVLLSCADIPPTDKEAIIGATMAMGGMDSDNVTKLTTHICALSMDHPKCQLAQSKKLKCKIVLPHWFDDCFKLGKRISEEPYCLPDPEIMRLNPEDSVRVPSSQHLEGATSARPDYMPSPPPDAGGRPILTAFEGKSIMLSSDLSIRDRLREIIKGLIENGGGRMTDDVEDCDWFICHYRDGPQYIRASQAENKWVGNLSWLYHIITHNQWTDPLNRLLHYPIPRDGIPGLKGKRITVSNYGGEARIYLENLIVATGAEFTKTMKADNTHLITARETGEKCEAAKDWQLKVVNHLWIEECYAKCEMLAEGGKKYTCFPDRTNLGEVIGKTPFDKSKLEALYYPKAQEDILLPTRRKRKMADIADENSYQDGPAEGVVIGRQSHKGIDIMKDTDAEYAEKTTDVFGVPAPAKGRTTSGQFATPAKGRYVRTGKENETPSTVSSSSRSAKDKALNRLSVLAPDIQLYEKEKKRGLKDNHGLWGGKRAADHIDREHLNRRSISSPVAANEEKDAKADKRPAKKARPSLPEVNMRVVLTGFQRWVNDKHREDADRKKLRDLGIAVVPDGQTCDYLVAPHLVRTVKFLRNLSKGATIVSSSWIEQCLDQKELLDPQDFVLKDKENEDKFGIKLSTSVLRARKNAGKLLWNTPIYCTSNIKNGPDGYRFIAEANGALFMMYGARSGTTIKPTRPEEDEGGPDPVYLLSNTSPEEKRLWKKFEDMARNGNMEPRIVAADWLLDVVMNQEVMFDDKYLVTNFFT